jgi:hypothetical protein
MMKCGDCEVVCKKRGITSDDEMLVVLGEIFGMVAATVDKYAKSFMFVAVKMFATSGGGTANGSVCGGCPPSDIFGDVLGGFHGFCK